MNRKVVIRVFFFVFLPFAVFGVLQSMYFSSSQHRALQEAMEQKALAVARLAAHNAAPSIDFDDQNGIKEIFNGVARDHDFLFIAVFNDTEDLYAEHNPNKISIEDVPLDRETPVLYQTDEHLSAIVPIALAGGERWHLLLGLSTTTIKEKDTDNYAIAILIGFITLVMGMGAAWWIASALQKIHKLARDAQEANRSKSQFLANMSHEIRTPMNGIIGMNELLLQTDMTTQQRKWARTIEKSSQSLLQIINDILDFSKIEAGMLELDIIEFSIEQTIDDVVETLMPIADQKSLRLISHVSPKIPRRVMGDSLRLQQVLINLIGNALKFTQKGHVVVRVAIANDDDKHVQVKFEVQDTGVGISPDAQSRLFEAFLQADSTTTREFGGTGLGLTISQRLVSAMGGDIAVESALGEGSRFFFTANFKKPEVDAEESPEMDLDALRIEGMHALVMSDYQADRDVLCNILREWGVEVAESASAYEALKLLAKALATETNDTKRPYDFVVIDMQNNPDEGSSLAHDIHSMDRYKSLPILAITTLDYNNSTPSNHIQCYLSKPIRRSLLLETIQSINMPEHLAVEGTRERGAPKTQLPAKLAESLPVQFGRRSTDIETPALPGERARILVAEDNEVNQMVLSASLKMLGYEARIVHNGREAIEILRGEHNQYAAVLMDCQMPVMDGYTAAATIRGEEEATGRERTTIIAVTAHAMEGDREKVLEAGMDDYLTKPVQMRNLQQALSKWLSKSRNQSRRFPDGGGTESISYKSDTGSPQLHSSVLNTQILQELEQMSTRSGSKFVEQLFDNYLSDSQRLLQDIAEALKDERADNAAKMAHTLKGSSRTIGAFEFAIVCEKLERTSRERDTDTARKLTDVARSELSRVHAEIRDRLAEKRGDN